MHTCDGIKLINFTVISKVLFSVTLNCSFKSAFLTYRLLSRLSELFSPHIFVRTIPVVSDCQVSMCH